MELANFGVNYFVMKRVKFIAVVETRFCSLTKIGPQVLKLDGTSEIGAHVWSEPDNFIC